MSAGISPENERFIEMALAAGKYQSRDEALDRALDLLRREELLEEVDAGLRDLREGRYIDYQPGEKDKFIADLDELAKRTQ